MLELWVDDVFIDLLKNFMDSLGIQYNISGGKFAYTSKNGMLDGWFAFFKKDDDSYHSFFHRILISENDYSLMLINAADIQIFSKLFKKIII